MTRWEILEEAKNVLNGVYGNGSYREWILKEKYGPIQRVVDAVLAEEDNLSKEIEERKEELRKLEERKK